MFTKTALTAAIILGTASVALATGEFDANPANRYPAFAAPISSIQTFQSAPVALQTSNVSLGSSQGVFAKTYDREGASHDGGTGR